MEAYGIKMLPLNASVVVGMALSYSYMLMDLSQKCMAVRTPCPPPWIRTCASFCARVSREVVRKFEPNVND